MSAEPRSKGRETTLYSKRVAEKGSSRRLGFRCTEFSETQSVPLLILEEPICRGILYVADRGYAPIHERLFGVWNSRKLSCR
jgi:hypothetical protein